MTDSAKIVFMPSGRRGEFPLGTAVLDAARSLGVDLDSVCGGRGICGRCQVDCVEGEFPKHGLVSGAGHLSGRGAVEDRYSEKRGPLPAGRRLGCQARIEGDVVIDVPPESQLHRQVVRKQADLRAITLDVSVHLHYVVVREAGLADASGDLARVFEALARDWGLDGLDCDPAVLPGLQAALRKGAWKITVAVHAGRRIIAVWPGFRDNVYGVALDIGSTTLAAHLVRLATGEVLATAGAMNPQIRFGEDLMSRVSYVMMHPGGEAELTQAVRTGVNGLLETLAREAGIDLSDIVEIAVAGNPIMHHLFLGISPVELGGAPFALAVDGALDLRARDLGLAMNPGAVAYMLPCIAGHVGADAAGMILAEEPHAHDAISLVVDVGTNAEIVLGNRDKLWACSSPTGPAFEGAQISCGQRAAPGAIERVRIDPETLAVRFRVIGSEAWSDEAGFAESIAGTGVTGICGSGIIEAVAEMYLAGVIGADGVVDGTLTARTPRVVADGRTFSFVLHERSAGGGNDNGNGDGNGNEDSNENEDGDGGGRIIVTQNDVRQIQLGKAALYAGIRLLMDHAGVGAVDRIRLAGAFGSHIDPRYAMVLGLIPDCPLEQVRSAGNAAGTGARIALLNRAARREIETVVRRIVKIETALEPAFQEHFVGAMAIPHRYDPFPNLFAVIQRPEPKQAVDNGARRMRRRHAAAAGRHSGTGANPSIVGLDSGSSPE